MTRETRLVSYTYAPETDSLDKTFGVQQEDINELVRRIIVNLNAQAKENEGKADFSVAFHEGIQGGNFGLVLALACKQIRQLMDTHKMESTIRMVLDELIKNLGRKPKGDS